VFNPRHQYVALRGHLIAANRIPIITTYGRVLEVPEIARRIYLYLMGIYKRFNLLNHTETLFTVTVCSIVPNVDSEWLRPDNYHT
jgi:hypothetical protein